MSLQIIKGQRQSNIVCHFNLKEELREEESKKKKQGENSCSHQRETLPATPKHYNAEEPKPSIKWNNLISNR